MYDIKMTFQISKSTWNCCTFSRLFFTIWLDFLWKKLVGFKEANYSTRSKKIAEGLSPIWNLLENRFHIGESQCLSKIFFSVSPKFSKIYLMRYISNGRFFLFFHQRKIFSNRMRSQKSLLF